MECMKKEDSPGEYRRIVEAALILCKLKNTKLDPKAAFELDQLKRKYLGTKPMVNNSHPPPAAGPFQQELNLLPGYNPPDIPSLPTLQGLIGSCSKPFEKQLTPSDVDKSQSRLAIHKSTVKELKKLLNEDESLSDGIPVTVYDAHGNEYPMEFKIWASKIHVLTGGWKKFSNDHKLIEFKDFVTLWMFRHVRTQGICFVITARRVPDAEPPKQKRKMKTKVEPRKQTKFLGQRLSQGPVEGSHALHLKVKDDKGRLMTIYCTTRKKGYKKPVLTKGWREYVRRKKLKVGDKIIFRQPEDGIAVYEIEAQRRIAILGKYVWSNVSDA